MARIELRVGVPGYHGPINFLLYDGKDAVPRGIAGIDMGTFFNLLDNFTKTVKKDLDEGLNN